MTVFGIEGDQLGQLKYPKGIVLDHQNLIYVAEGSRVQIFEQDGKFISSFGANGDGPGQFDNIEGLCSTTNGDLLVCDKGNQRIQALHI